MSGGEIPEERRRLLAAGRRKLSLASTEVFTRGPVKLPPSSPTPSAAAAAAVAMRSRLRRNSSAGEASTAVEAEALREELQRRAEELAGAGDQLGRALLAGFVDGGAGSKKRSVVVSLAEEDQEEEGVATTSGKLGLLTPRARRRLLARAQTAHQARTIGRGEWRRVNEVLIVQGKSLKAAKI